MMAVVGWFLVVVGSVVSGAGAVAWATYATDAENLLWVGLATLAVGVGAIFWPVSDEDPTLL